MPEIKQCATDACPHTGRWKSDYCPACRAYHKRATSNGAEWCVVRQALLGRWDERLTYIIGRVKRGRRG